MANIGAIPKFPIQQKQSALLTTGDQASAPHLTKQITKRVTFNEVPIICEMLNDSFTADSLHQKCLPKLPQHLSKIANNAAQLPSSLPAYKDLGRMKTHSKPTLVRKTNRTRKVNKPLRTTATNVTSAQEGVNSDSVLDNVYAHPELHSSLHIANMLQAVQLEEFDADRAIKDKLKSCRMTRRQLDERSSRPLNIPADEIVFRDVTSLEFDEQAFLTATTEEKEGKYKALLPVARRRDPEPDIREFLTDDMQPEFVAIPEPNFEFQLLKMPAKAPLSSVYHLYKHKRMWEGLP